MILKSLVFILELLTILFLLYGFSALAATFLFIHPFHSRSDYSPKAYNLPFTKVQFYSRDGRTKLSGWLMRHNQASEGLVIICHGLMSSKAETLPLAAFIFRNEYDCLVFDFRAHGESDGFFSNLGYREKEDLLGAIQYAEANHLTFDRKVIVIGFSMGAAAALLASAETDQISSLVCDSSYADGMALLKRNFSLFFHGLPKKYFWGICWFFLRKIGGYPENPEKPLDAVKKLRDLPIFFIHGEGDQTISVSHTKALFKKCPSVKKELWIVPQVGHAEAYDQQTDLYQKKLLQFLGKKVEKKGDLSLSRDGVVDVAAGVIIQDGKVLIARRIKGKHLEGMWEFPGGKLKPGESPQMAVIREIREEVNLEVIVEHLIDTVMCNYPDRKIKIHFFKCRVLQGAIRAIKWGEVQWVNHQDFDQIGFPPANQPILSKVKGYLE